MAATNAPDGDPHARLALLFDCSLTKAATQSVKSAIADEAQQSYPEAWRVRESLLELKRPTARTGSAESLIQDRCPR